MEGSKHIFLVILYNIIATVDSTCPSNDMKCCHPGLYWNKELNICTGCEIGFFGQNCAHPCRFPSYGRKCQQRCNCTQDLCDIVNGCRNSSDCNFGYYGKTCSDPCRFPSYGERCQSECNCSETACNHSTGCQSGTEILETLVWNTTSQGKGGSFTDNIQAVIIIGGSIIFTFIFIFVLVIITLLRKNKTPDQRKEFECNSDSEFSSCYSLPGDTVHGTCTTSARYVQNIELNGKSVECYEFEIYENTCIQGNSQTFSLNYNQ